MLTYRRGKYAQWPAPEFELVSGKVDGRQLSYRLAERPVELLKGFAMREVRRLCDSGQQTSVVTTRRDLAGLEVAYRMFERWTQENFFRYMRQHFALDALLTYAVEPADAERTVRNPQYLALGKELGEARAMLKELEHDYGQKARAHLESRKPLGRERFEQAHAALRAKIESQRDLCKQLAARRSQLPKRVAIKEIVAAAEIVKLDPETKHVSDTIKMVAYRAETALVTALAPHYARNEEEGRALVRQLLLSSADIVPQPQEQHLVVKVHSQATVRSNRALRALCAILNAEAFRYPGTDLVLVYEAPGVA